MRKKRVYEDVKADMRTYEKNKGNMLYISLIMSNFTERKQTSRNMEKEYRIRPYYKSELAEAYAPCLSLGAALNRLAHWIDTNTELTEALAQTGYRRTQRVFTSRQVALIFEYLGEP